MAKRSMRAVNQPDPENGQAELPGVDAQLPSAPKTVSGDYMMAEYVSPHYSIDKERERYVSMEFSLGVTKEHEKLLPSTVRKALKFISTGGLDKPKITNINIKPQAVAIYLASIGDKAPSFNGKATLSMLCAEITHGALAVVEQTGNGKATEQIRFSFRIREKVDENLCDFADNSFGETTWISLKPVQGELEA